MFSTVARSGHATRRIVERVSIATGSSEPQKRMSAMSHRSTLVLCLVGLLTLASAAHAQSRAETNCQATIGREARRFASDAFEAAFDCANVTAAGRACNES